MRFTFRGNSSALRRGGAFSVSLGIHAAALGWVIVSAALGFSEKPRPIYDAEIRPYESKIVWYHLQTRVPNVRPVEAKLTRKPPRAVRKLDQNLIAGAKELPTPPQKVWVPEPPKVEPPKPKIEAASQPAGGGAGSETAAAAIRSAARAGAESEAGGEDSRGARGGAAASRDHAAGSAAGDESAAPDAPVRSTAAGGNARPRLRPNRRLRLKSRRWLRLPPPWR